MSVGRKDLSPAREHKDFLARESAPGLSVIGPAVLDARSARAAFGNCRCFADHGIAERGSQPESNAAHEVGSAVVAIAGEGRGRH